MDHSSMPQADPLTPLRACRRTNVGVPSDVGEVLAAMTTHVPLCRTARASASSPLSVSISIFNSTMDRAAVA